MLEADKVIYRRALIVVVVACLLGVATWFLFLKNVPWYSLGGTPVAAENADYVGSWQAGNTMDLIITKDGRAHYQHFTGTFTTTLDLPLQSITPQTISLGMAFWKTDLAVQSPPHQQDGKWHMTVENTDLTRKD